MLQQFSANLCFASRLPGRARPRYFLMNQPGLLLLVSLALTLGGCGTTQLRPVVITVAPTKANVVVNDEPSAHNPTTLRLSPHEPHWIEVHAHGYVSAIGILKYKSGQWLVENPMLKWPTGHKASGTPFKTKGKLIEVTLPEDEISALSKQAREGNATAQVNLGYRCWKGIAIPANPTEARCLLAQAAEQKDSRALVLYAHFLQEGIGGPQEPDRAEQLLTQLAPAKTKPADQDKPQPAPTDPAAKPDLQTVLNDLLKAAQETETKSLVVQAKVEEQKTKKSKHWWTRSPKAPKDKAK
jgi:hypothetical protein